MNLILKGGAVGLGYAIYFSAHNKDVAILPPTGYWAEHIAIQQRATRHGARTV